MATMRRITKAFRMRASGEHPFRRSVNSTRLRRWRVSAAVKSRSYQIGGSSPTCTMCNQGLVVWRILQRSVQLPDMPSLLRRGEHALVHEHQQDVALLVDTVLIRGLAKAGKEIGQDLVAMPRLGDAPSPLDPPCRLDRVGTSRPGAQCSTGTKSQPGRRMRSMMIWAW